MKIFLFNPSDKGKMHKELFPKAHELQSRSVPNSKLRMEYMNDMDKNKTLHIQHSYGRKIFMLVPQESV